MTSGPHDPGHGHDPAAEPVEDLPPTPFLFKVTVLLAVVYLGWRLIQGVVWLFQALAG